MNEAEDSPSLRDVIEPHEEAQPDHREHAKASDHVDDESLDRRTEQERAAVERDRSDPRRSS